MRQVWIVRVRLRDNLKEQSKTFGNTRTTRFQFHVSASVKGKLVSAEELTDFAQELMQQAGYGSQPYFVYFHNDTDNNHIHIVSTRIKPNGFPISDHQDYRRLNTCANRILSHDIKKDIESILGYDYETEGQFANIIRSYGYKFEKTDKGYRLFKAGGDAGEIGNKEFQQHISSVKQDRKERAIQPQQLSGNINLKLPMVNSVMKNLILKLRIRIGRKDL